jgi:energy-coupling factor transport system ATP-binding protein
MATQRAAPGAVNDTAQLLAIAGLSAVLFFLGLAPLEAVPEIPVDIDQKPFFIPLTLVALLPLGRSTLAVAAGAALGEAIRDLLEGYEIDDPLGAVGYVAAFLVGGYLIGNHPRSRVRLVIAGIVAGSLQAVFEASTFVLLSDKGIDIATWAWAGNTVTHGLIGGALPLLFVVPAFYGKVERFLGFAPKGTEEPPIHELDEPGTAATGTQGTPGMIRLDGFSFAYPGTDRVALRRVSCRLSAGQVLGVVGEDGSGRTTLCMALAGLVPRVTGGRTAGCIEVGGRDPRTTPTEEMARRVGLVFEDHEAQLTQIDGLDEVMLPMLTRGTDPDEARRRATELIRRVGLDENVHRRRTWELSAGEQIRLAIAAVLAVDPEVLVLDSPTASLGPAGRAEITRLVRDLAGDKTLVVVGDDLDLLAPVVDRLLVLRNGESRAEGTTEEVLRDGRVLTEAGVSSPVPIRAARGVGLDPAEVTMDEFRHVLLGTDGDQPTDGARPAPSQRARRPDRPSADPVVALEDVNFSYPDGTEALRGVSLQVDPGEVHAVIGGDGAGKTTLLRAVVGLARPASGKVTLDGLDTREHKVRDLAVRVGTAFARPDEQITEATVAEEVAFPLAQRRFRRTGLFGRREDFDAGHIERRVRRACELVGLDPALLEQDPRLLPGGLRTLVVLAEAVILDPPVVVFDEPSARLDARQKHQLRRLIGMLRRDGKAVILAENDIDLVAEVADRVTFLVDGSVALQGQRDEVLGRANWGRLLDGHARPPRAAELAVSLGVEALTLDELVGSAWR